MQAETEESQRVESLQLEIEKVEGDICRKSHYTRQLEHMLLRLRSNQVIIIYFVGTALEGQGSCFIREPL